MQNPKTGGSRWVPDIRPENIDTYTETNTPEGGTEQSAQYKIVDAHPIIGGVLDKLAFFRTHASAVWYNKMKNITVLQKLDNLASNIGTLVKLTTTDKTSLVNAVNELNVKMGGATSPYSSIFFMNVTDLNNPPDAIIFMSSPTSAGYPSTLGGNRCIVLYLNAGDTYRAQLAFGFGSDRIAIRRKIHTTTWTEWKYFTAS